MSAEAVRGTQQIAGTMEGTEERTDRLGRLVGHVTFGEQGTEDLLKEPSSMGDGAPD